MCDYYPTVVKEPLDLLRRRRGGSVTGWLLPPLPFLILSTMPTPEKRTQILEGEATEAKELRVRREDMDYGMGYLG